MDPLTVINGESPLILAQPHGGTYVPSDIWVKLNAHGQELRDTDWHIPRLYGDLVSDVTIVRANFSRYVIDANRDPNGASLYPGQNTTGLIPVKSFDDLPIWIEPPTEREIENRLEQFHHFQYPIRLQIL